MAEGEHPDPAAASSEAERAAQDMQAFRAAAETVNGWAAGAAAFALLRAALDAGVLEAARTPVSVAQLAASTGLTEPLLGSFCVALEAHGILLRDGEQYHLAPDIAYLLSDESQQRLPVWADGHQSRVRTLERLATATPEAPPSPEDSLARARVITQPLSPAGRIALRAVADRMPEVKAIWEAGGRHCDLGCGVGGALLGTLMLFPRLTAVGIDLDARLLDEAHQNAIRLGVAERVELRHMDARELRDEAAFDTAHWAQWFFPRASRAATLAAIYRALRPGGYLHASLAAAPTAPDKLQTPEGRGQALRQLVFGCWGVTFVGDVELRAELEEAGFTDLRTTREQGGMQMLARRPLG